MAVYGPVRHQKNIILTEASEVHIIFFGDVPVHILPYDPKWHELFAKLYFLSKIIMQTSEASVNIIFFWWRTGPYTAIWPSVPWTICYLSNFLFWRKQNVYTNQRLRWSSLISIHPKKIQYLYRVPRGRCVTWHEVSIEGQTVKKLISRKDPLSIMSLRKLVIIKCSCLFL
jgi:hypothetical protein